MTAPLTNVYYDILKKTFRPKVADLPQSRHCNWWSRWKAFRKHWDDEIVVFEPEICEVLSTADWDFFQLYWFCNGPKVCISINQLNVCSGTPEEVLQVAAAQQRPPPTVCVNDGSNNAYIQRWLEHSRNVPLFFWWFYSSLNEIILMPFYLRQYFPFDYRHRVWTGIERQQ